MTAGGDDTTAPGTASATSNHDPAHAKRLVVLISGRGSNLNALIRACADGRIHGRIVEVISNRPQAPGLEFARQAEIPRSVVDHRAYPDRESFDGALADRIKDCSPDLVILAGFMRVLTERFVARFAGRMVNIHPSLLPDFRGLDTHARALAAGVDTHGASVHFVTAELDGGPVLMQARIPVHPGDNPEKLAQRVQAVEHELYPAAVGLICSGRVQLWDSTVRFDDNTLEQPLLLGDITERI